MTFLLDANLLMALLWENHGLASPGVTMTLQTCLSKLGKLRFDRICEDMRPGS